MTTRRWCMHPDLGIYMGRHSTLNSYLMNILALICGRLGVRGGNLIPGMVMPLGFHADERKPKTWRTIATGMPPAAAGSFPPAVVPEEILQEHPERLRAVYVNGCNPLRSYPDTTAYETAFKKLDLLVVCDIVMSETARYAHYILPCKNAYESWDGTFFPWTYPGVYFQMRQPLVEAPGDCLEASRENAARAGFKPGLDQGDRIFEAILENPRGLWVGQADTANPMDGIATSSGKIEVYIPELEEQVKRLDAGSEKKDLELSAEFPLILNAGRHMQYNANTLMRNPAWNEGKKACTIAMHPDNIRVLGLCAGRQVRITTEAGSEVGELEMSSDVRQGTVLIPHGFGLVYAGEVYGINVNRLTKNSHRDPLGTPLHRYVPCRVETAEEQLAPDNHPAIEQGREKIIGESAC